MSTLIEDGPGSQAAFMALAEANGWTRVPWADVNACPSGHADHGVDHAECGYRKYAENGQLVQWQRGTVRVHAFWNRGGWFTLGTRAHEVQTALTAAV